MPGASGQEPEGPCRRLKHRNASYTPIVALRVPLLSSFLPLLLMRPRETFVFNNLRKHVDGVWCFGKQSTFLARSMVGARLITYWHNHL